MKILLSALCFVALVLAATTYEPRPADAIMCFKTGEQISGLNKICYYDCAGSTAAITIKSYELCPLSINQ